METKEIRFYWNGIKVNGGSLIKCLYSMHDDGEIRIIASDYSHSIPADVFAVINNSDYYTDYFDDDHADVDSNHPLYKFVRYAWYKLQLHDLKHTVTVCENRAKRNPRYADGYLRQAREAHERLEDLDVMENPGNPTAEDLAKVEAMNQATETARLAAEHEQELQEREKYLEERNSGECFIRQTAEENPIVEGQPIVTIEWSENPAFYAWEDGELKLSIAAAEIILKHFDELVHDSGRGGYDKTSFRIDYINQDGGEDSYTGRYDLGDNDGGMIAHIRSFGQYSIDNAGKAWGCSAEEGRQIVAIADYLEDFTAKPQIISINIHPALKKAAERRRASASDTLAMVEMLTDDQLAQAVMMISPDDAAHRDVARFFLQQLAHRDEKRALQVMRDWLRGKETA